MRAMADADFSAGIHQALPRLVPGTDSSLLAAASRSSGP